MSSKKSRKGKVESSDSDSGPEDRNVPVSKKAKTSSNASTDKEPTFQLSKTRSVKVREFRGKLMVDIREYYESDGDLKPGKKGICLSVEQYQKLKSIIPEIDEAMAKM